MVLVGKVLVRMGHRCVPVAVRVPSRNGLTGWMMVVVQVVLVYVFVLQSVVPMRVSMALAEVEPDADGHE